MLRLARTTGPGGQRPGQVADAPARLQRPARHRLVQHDDFRITQTHREAPGRPILSEKPTARLCAHRGQVRPA